MIKKITNKFIEILRNKLIFKFDFQNSMNLSSVRVCIEYNSCRKLICFDYGLEEKEMLQKSLQLFELEEQFYLDYELIIPTLNCKISPVTY